MRDAGAARWVIAALVIVGPVAAACASSNSGSGAGGSNDGGGDGASDGTGGSGDCAFRAESCDVPTQALSQVDLEAGCARAPIPVPEVCVSSVNRCAPSAGLFGLCAFAPDGGVFVSGWSDNDVPTAKGWRFALATGYPLGPGDYPADERATEAEYAQCAELSCAPPCPGVTSLGFTGCLDAGGAALDSGAVADGKSDG